MIVFILQAIEPIVKIRIGYLYNNERIGHLAYSADLYLRRMTLQAKSRLEIHVVIVKSPANQQLLNLIKRKMLVLEGHLFLKLYHALRLRTSKARVWIDLPVDYRAFYEFNTIPPQLAFTEREKRRGRIELSRMGISDKDPFVCILSRDKAYLNRTVPSRDWSYHDFRDTEVSNYLKAAEYLASKGLFVLRIGHTAERSLVSSNPRIIDYATRYRSDFMDIYLLGNCKFYLGDHSGPQCVTRAFGIPAAIANWVQFIHPPWREEDIYIPKKLWSREKKRFLAFKEIFTSDIRNWCYTRQFADANIEVIENTADEISDLAEEMNARIEKTWVSNGEDQELYQRFKALFSPDNLFYRSPARIGSAFLRQNRELLN